MENTGFIHLLAKTCQPCLMSSVEISIYNDTVVVHVCNDYSYLLLVFVRFEHKLVIIKQVVNL